MCQFARDRNLQSRYSSATYISLKIFVYFFRSLKKITLLKDFISHEFFIVMDKKPENFKYCIQL